MHHNSLPSSIRFPSDERRTHISFAIRLFLSFFYSTFLHLLALSAVEYGTKSRSRILFLDRVVNSFLAATGWQVATEKQSSARFIDCLMCRNGKWERQTCVLNLAHGSRVLVSPIHRWNTKCKHKMNEKRKNEKRFDRIKRWPICWWATIDNHKTAGCRFYCFISI